MNNEIKNLIFTIRDKQVMLDRDVAMLYGYETKYINRTASRNVARFPEAFCFQLTNEEYLRCQNGTANVGSDLILQSQIVTANPKSRVNPYVFTEQGIIMLAGLLKNETAVKASIAITKAFVEMREFITSNAHVFAGLSEVRYKLYDHDKKFDEVFDKIQEHELPKQGIFFDSQIFDAYSQIIKIIKKAKASITIIDNFPDITALDILKNKLLGVKVNIITKNTNKSLSLTDIDKFNSQYPTLKMTSSDKFHDRFIIIDDKTVYLVGASLKDAGKKTFAIVKIEDKDDIIKKVKDNL